MPVVLRIGPYTFSFYSLENGEPPHIHVRRDGLQAKFWLVPVELANTGGFRPNEINRIIRHVRDNQILLLKAWNDYFENASR